MSKKYTRISIKRTGSDVILILFYETFPIGKLFSAWKKSAFFHDNEIEHLIDIIYESKIPI